jgi:hypothetical protein
MDQVSVETAAKAENHKEHNVAVAVIMTVAVYPDEDDFRRVGENTVIAKVLHLAAEKYEIKNTADWVALVDGREIDASKTFKQEKLDCIVEIEWHKREGGGGA